MMQERGDATHEESGRSRPALEWIVGMLSAVIVGGLVSFLGYQAVSGGKRPADLAVAVERVEQRYGSTTITFVVTNRGDAAASTVKILAAGPEGVPPKHVEFDYIASNAEKRGTLVFSGMSDAKQIKIEIDSYTDP